MYLRLETRDVTTHEGKRHVETVPVKLVKAQNDLRKKHPDRIFAAENIKFAQEIATHMGPEAVSYLSTVQLNR